MTAEQRYERLLAIAQDDSAILGCILVGSRGKELVNEFSDYDVNLIVEEEHVSEYRQRLEAEYTKAVGFDLSVFSLHEFREYAAWGGSEAWGRYAYAHVKATVDKTGGELQQLIDEKGLVPEKHVRQLILNSLDWYINQVYRSLKCLRAGDMVGYRLEASESIRPLLTAAFCLHGRRTMPYYKYLELELEKAPLDRYPWSNKTLVNKLLKILEDGDYVIQQELLRETHRIFRAEGYGEIFDSWEGDDEWAMNFVPRTEISNDGGRGY